MNGNTRRKLYQLIVEKDGEFCKCCGKLPHEGQLIIDHRDNNPKNNPLENLQLLCRTCNFLKNQRPVYLSVRESVEINYDTELETNRKKEPQFKKFVIHQINERENVSWKELVYSGAEIHGLSPITIERYLRKLTSPAGLFQTRLVGDIEIVEYKDEFFDL